MKKILILILCVLALYAERAKLSSIPPLVNVMVDLEVKECSNLCLKELYEQGLIFSFLAKYKQSAADETVTHYHDALKIALRMNDTSNIADMIIKDVNFEGSGYSDIKIALLVPQKVIGKYSISVANAMLSYLLYKKGTFEFEVFNCNDEAEESIMTGLQKIKEKGYRLVIAPVTMHGAQTIASFERDLVVFIPTINKNDTSIYNSNIFFGGIDYHKQISQLLMFSNERIGIFSDPSQLSQKLTELIRESSFDNIVVDTMLEKTKGNLQYKVKNYKLKNASIFLNMPLVKSSLIASQLSYYDIVPYALLSTQINYHPMLLYLTQYKDREQLYIANSISESDFLLNDINMILGNNLSYNWIDYSTAIGLDYMYSNFVDAGGLRVFQEQITDNQIEYKIRIMRPEIASFSEVRFSE